MGSGEFYVVGIVYMCSRIAMNATAVFLPLYIALATTNADTMVEDEAVATSF